MPLGLADLLEKTNRPQEADPLYQQAITIFTKTLGEEHPNTKGVKQNYQNFLDKQNSN